MTALPYPQPVKWVLRESVFHANESKLHPARSVGDRSRRALRLAPSCNRPLESRSLRMSALAVAKQRGRQGRSGSDRLLGDGGIGRGAPGAWAASERMTRIYLSPPDLSGEEIEFLRDAITSNWIAPLGPHVDAFEQEFSEAVGVPHAAAVSSGTAALHLALLLLGVEPGDEVICPTLTFAASAFAIRYVGAIPVFVDVERESWNLDPELLGDWLMERRKIGKLPKAAIVVDLYGQSADWDAIRSVLAVDGIPIVEDAAEALGATYKDRPVGGFGAFGVFSFNGNKIITTSGGGMLVSEDEEAIARARYLASQARCDQPYYEHIEIGFNYRMSNLLAAVGRAQLRVLKERIDARRRLFAWYRKLLGDLPGLRFMPEAPYGRATRWLTCLTIDPERFRATSDDVRIALEKSDIEARPVWKPMQLQPVFEGCETVGGQVSRRLFERGLCLPSGSALERNDVERIAAIIRRVGEGGGG